MSKEIPFLHLEGKGVDAKLFVEDESFPLTVDGCIAAGVYLFEKRYVTWNYSSSCDFPEEHKRWFKADIRERVMEGYVGEATQEFPKDDWKYEVANDDTVLGYSEWVEHKIEDAAHDEEGDDE